MVILAGVTAMAYNHFFFFFLYNSSNVEMHLSIAYFVNCLEIGGEKSLPFNRRITLKTGCKTEKY